VASVPGKGRVNRALRAAQREVKGASSRVNQKAAKLLARGDYEGAEVLVDLGRRVQEFGSQLTELTHAWRQLRGAAGDQHNEKLESTATWKLYSPILKTLIANDGTMTWKAVEEGLGSSSDFQPVAGDLVMRKGKPGWVSSVRKARAGLVKEGFVERRGGLEWRITAAGRKAADSEVRP